MLGWFQALMPKEERFFHPFSRHAETLVMATGLGAPVSTTHTITGSIMGVGAARRASAVRWGVARGIAVAWVVTIPMAGLIAAGAYWTSALFLKA
jgi:PiT family inorganic phosphate transporter